MVTLAMIRQWRADQVREVASVVATRAAALAGVLARLRGIAPTGWSGEAADAAQAARGDLQTIAADREDELTTVAEALRAAAGRLDEVGLDLAAIEGAASADGFALTDDGCVLDARVGEVAAADAYSAQERVEAQRRIRADVERLVAVADEIDRALAAALTGIGDGSVLSEARSAGLVDDATFERFGVIDALPDEAAPAGEAAMDADGIAWAEEATEVVPDTEDPQLAEELSADRVEQAAVEDPVAGPWPVAAATIVAPPGSRDRDLSVRAHQAVGVVGAATAKWGHGPVTDESRRRYDEDDAFADAVDTYAEHNDVGMLARDVLLSTGDEELAGWVYEHPYEWAHPVGGAQSPDGAPYAMDVPVQHSARTQWARMATAAANGYLEASRPSGLGATSPVREAEAVKRAASDGLTPLLNDTHVRMDSQARQIVDGHAYRKHVLGLDARGRARFTPDMPEITSPAELVERTRRTMWTRPEVQLSEGRTMHLDPHDDHLVVTDPRTRDGGTSFRVTRPGYVQERVLGQDSQMRVAQGLPPEQPVSPAPVTWEERYLSGKKVWVDHQRTFAAGEPPAPEPIPVDPRHHLRQGVGVGLRCAGQDQP